MRCDLTKSQGVAGVLTNLGARDVTIRLHCPWKNSKVERFTRTLQSEWAYRRIYLTKTERSHALQPGLDYYNYHRKQLLPRTQTTQQPSVTDLMAGFT